MGIWAELETECCIIILRYFVLFSIEYCSATGKCSRCDRSCVLLNSNRPSVHLTVQLSSASKHEHLRAALHHLRAVIFLFIKALRAIVPLASANPSPGRAHDPYHGESGPAVLKCRHYCRGDTKRDNDAALARGVRPIQHHEPAARHRRIMHCVHQSPWIFAAFDAVVNLYTRCAAYRAPMNLSSSRIHCPRTVRTSPQPNLTLAVHDDTFYAFHVLQRFL